MSMAAEEARYTCQQKHGDLVSISSKDENVFLWKQVGIYCFTSTTIESAPTVSFITGLTLHRFREAMGPII